MSSRRLIFAFLLLLGSGVVVELIARIILREPDGYFLFPPHQTAVHHRLPVSMIPDARKTARRSINGQGVCGPEVGPEPEYRILAIGGSTTACNVMDWQEAWPARLQAHLSEKLPHEHIWVGNLGKDGLNTRHHLVTLDRFLPQHPRVDALLFLVGANDFLGRLAQDEQFQPLSVSQIGTDAKTVERAFAIIPPEAHVKAWYRQLGLWRLAKRMRAAAAFLRQPTPEEALARARARKKTTAEVLSTLPDLGPALAEYERNLEALIARARARGLRVIFMTQPTIWKREGMTPEETEVLMFGFVGPGLREARAYYTASALAEGMERYNEALKQVCRRERVECIDLASNLQRDLSVFYDDCHFNIAGADEVARIVAAYLLDANDRTDYKLSSQRNISKTPQ